MLTLYKADSILHAPMCSVCTGVHTGAEDVCSTALCIIPLSQGLTLSLKQGQQTSVIFLRLLLAVPGSWHPWPCMGGQKIY